MPPSRRSQAEDRSGHSKAKGKRKLVESEEADANAGPRKAKQPRSIAELFSSSQEDPGADQQRGQLKKNCAQTRHMQTAQHDHPSSMSGDISLANMYTFSPSKSQPEGVIDLTDSSPPSGSQFYSHSKPLNSAARPATFTPHQGPKKLVVKNLRTTPRADPEQYFTKIWTQLDTSLTAIFNNEKPAFSLEELYKGAENGCRQGKAPELYKRLRQRCKSHMVGKVKADLLAAATEGTDKQLLKAFVEAWSMWNTQLMTVRSIFFYMDQSYLLRSSENPSILQMGLILFRINVFADAVLKPKFLSGAIDLVGVDREGSCDEDDTSLLKKAVDTFHTLSTYTSDFEPSLSKASEVYFNSWCKNEKEKNSLPSFASNATNLLSREMTRCDIYSFDRSTRVLLSDLYDEIVVGENADFLTDEDSVLDLLERNDYQALQKTYVLLARKGRGQWLGPTYDKFVVDEGTEIVFDDKREAEMVVNLLDFKKRLDHILKFCFSGNEALGNGLHKSFEFFINRTKKTQATWDTDNAKPGEMIAKHLDLLLRGGVKAVPRLLTASKSDSSKHEEDEDVDENAADEDAEINLHLSHALDLFRFVHGKAVFEAFYKKDLARRLLMARSASNDAERSMLSRLKNECGSGFTHNLESMFKDMDLARDEIASYNQLLMERGTKNHVTDLNVNVLSAAAWPTYADVPVNIPTEISKLTSEFEYHYKTKHNGRKLAWKHALSHCQLKANFPKGKKELVVSGFQAIILLLFNDVPTDASTLSYTDMQSASGLPDAELKRTLQSLACAKYRVLTKTPKGREVNETDKFSYNPNFQDQKMRIKINQIQLKETKEENKETHERVAADRNYETQAAIVRIMKSRKTIRHVELVSEVIKATRTRGVLDPADIKKNIERLIEKEYMEREEGNVYAYVA